MWSSRIWPPILGEIGGADCKDATFARCKCLPVVGLHPFEQEDNWSEQQEKETVSSRFNQAMTLLISIVQPPSLLAIQFQPLQNNRFKRNNPAISARARTVRARAAELPAVVSGQTYAVAWLPLLFLSFFLSSRFVCMPDSFLVVTSGLCQGCGAKGAA